MPVALRSGRLALAVLTALTVAGPTTAPYAAVPPDTQPSPDAC
jgi:hypothetical protein